MGMLEYKIPRKPRLRPRAFRRILKSDHYGRIFKLLPFHRRHMGVRQVSALSELKVGERGILVALDLPESVQNHLMHMGFVPDAASRPAPRPGRRPHRLLHRRHGNRATPRDRRCHSRAPLHRRNGRRNATEEAPELAEAAR